MTLRLRDHLYWCLANGRLVFLDVADDRYFCLPFAAEAAFLRTAEGGAGAEDRDRLRGMIARGMLIEDVRSPGLLRPAAPPSIQGDLPIPPGCRAPPTAMARMFIAEAGVILRLRTGSLLQTLARAGEAPQGACPADEAGAQLLRIVTASSRLAALAGAADRCLVRALAVHALCRGKGIPSSLVFGVQMNPFGAHCWVQHDGRVVVGDYEQARQFTPILVAG